MTRTLILIIAVLAAIYIFGGLTTPWFNYQALVARAHLQTGSFSPYMTSVWSVLTRRAIALGVADETVHFEISWLGIIVVIAVLLFLRLLRR